MKKTVDSAKEFETLAEVNGFSVVYDRKNGKLRAFNGTELVGVYYFTASSGYIETVK